MMETLIAIGVGVVVAGGILTLVWRILTGDREQKRLESDFERFLPAEQKAAEEPKKKRKN